MLVGPAEPDLISRFLRRRPTPRRPRLDAQLLAYTEEMPNFVPRLRAPAVRLTLVLLFVLLAATLWHLDPRVGRLWLNSARLACATCLIALPLGTLLAVAIFKTDVPGRKLATLLLVGLLFVPLYLVTGAWDAGFGIQGWYTLATNPHLAHQPWSSGWPAAFGSTPWAPSLGRVDRRCQPGGRSGDRGRCCYLCPAAKSHVVCFASTRAPAIVLAGVWVAIVTTTEISVTDFFQVRTFAEEAYTQSALGTFDFNTDAVPASRGGPGSAQLAAPTLLPPSRSICDRPVERSTTFHWPCTSSHRCRRPIVCRSGRRPIAPRGFGALGVARGPPRLSCG